MHLCPGFKGVGVISLNAYAIRPAQWIGAQCSGLDGENCILLPAVTAKGKGFIADAWVLGAVNDKALDFKVAFLTLGN